MTQPITPFADLFAQLSQGMSAAGSVPVVNDVGWQKDAQHTTVDRLAWIPRSVASEPQDFELPGAVTPWRQACRFDVSIYGSSLDRLLGLHALMVGWLDLLVGPPRGAPPSDDAAPATIRGTVDLAALVYPYSDLAGLSIAVTEPGARSLSFPLTPLSSPQAIASAINVAAQAESGPVAGVRARLVADEEQLFLELLLPTDPLGTAGATLTIDPDADDSACAELGFSSDDDNVSATGTPATYPYRPGYMVDASAEPGIRGGDLSAQGWGVIVPVTLYRPIPSMQFVTGVIGERPLQVVATGGDTPEEPVVNIQ